MGEITLEYINIERKDSGKVGAAVYDAYNILSYFSWFSFKIFKKCMFISADLSSGMTKTFMKNVILSSSYFEVLYFTSHNSFFPPTLISPQSLSFIWYLLLKHNYTKYLKLIPLKVSAFQVTCHWHPGPSMDTVDDIIMSCHDHTYNLYFSPLMSSPNTCIYTIEEFLKQNLAYSQWSYWPLKRDWILGKVIDKIFVKFKTCTAAIQIFKAAAEP